MKKVLKNTLLLVVMLMAVVLLAGCVGNKIVATKTTDDYSGKYEEKLEAKLKDDKVSEVKITYEYEDEESATFMHDIFESIVSIAGEENVEEFKNFQLSQDGKIVVVIMDGAAFMKLEGAEESEMTKEGFKALLEEQDYIVK